MTSRERANDIVKVLAGTVANLRADNSINVEAKHSLDLTAVFLRNEIESAIAATSMASREQAIEQALKNCVDAWTHEGEPSAIGYEVAVAQAIAALAAPALGWTKERPTVEGLWWHREIGEDDYPEVVEVEDRLHGLVVMYIGMDGSDELSKIDGEWAGPIEPPLEVPT
jgi:hypothetical protein